MNISRLSREEVFASVVTSAQGLAEDEAARRLREFGGNEIGRVKTRPAVVRLLGHFTHFLAVVLWIAAGLAFLSEWLHPGEGMAALGIAIIAVIVINAIFTFFQEYRAERALASLQTLLPFAVTVLRKGVEREITTREVAPGDVILLSEGVKVPADARLVACSGLAVNNASLTGESEPQPRTSEPFAGELIDSPNIVFAGTTVAAGSGAAVVFATGMRTEFGRIAHLTSAVEAGLSPLQKEIVKATRVAASIAALVGVFFFLVGFAIGRGFWENFIFGIGITVALVPEGMLPTVTLALAMGSQRMVRRKALIKTLHSVETLGAVTVICTDKTGTLTQNRMTVTTLWTDGELSDLRPVDRDAPAGLVLRAAAFCNNARLLAGGYKGDPTETALLKASREGIGEVAGEREFELPFDAERRMMSVVAAAGGRRFVFMKGACEAVLPKCVAVRAGSGDRLLDDDLRDDALHAYHTMMDLGLRVLALAQRELREAERPGDAPGGIESGMTLLGLVGLHDPPRPEVRGAVERCRAAGIRIIMITGDGSRTALAVARQIGLVADSPELIDGAALAALRDDELRQRLAAREVIFSRMAPKDKMRVVSLLKEAGEVVAVTGDGVNDAPALKKADIGVAMGLAGTDVAKEAADMILLDDNFATIVNAVEEGRAVYDNIKKFITYIFASNIPEAVPYLASVLLPIPLPLTIMQILAVDLGTDMLPALALGAERPTPGVMRLPPRPRTERLLRPGLLARAYLFLGIFEAAACMFAFFLVLDRGGWSWGYAVGPHDRLYLQATAACLTAIIVTQIANVFACRSSRESLWSLGWFSNPLIFAGIAVELLLLLAIVYHPVGNRVFQTAPVPGIVWLAAVPFALALLFGEELRKWILRRRGPPAKKA